MVSIPQKTILTRSILVLAAIIFAAILLETGMRLFLPQPQNLAKLSASKIFIHENKPGEIFKTKTEMFGNLKIYMNSSGFRDSEFSKSKDPDTIRIAILGDSFEEAMQMPLDYRWPKLMQEKLRVLLDKKTAVYNFGVSGYGTDQEWLVLKYKVLAFKPDIVLLTFSPNDVGDVYKNLLFFNQKGSLKI